MSQVPNALIFPGTGGDFAATYKLNQLGSVNPQKLITLGDGSSVEVTDENWIDIYHDLLIRKQAELKRELTTDDKNTFIQIVLAKKNAPRFGSSPGVINVYDPAVQKALADVKADEGVLGTLTTAANGASKFVGEAATWVEQEIKAAKEALPDWASTYRVVEIVSVAAIIFFIYKIVK